MFSKEQSIIQIDQSLDLGDSLSFWFYVSHTGQKNINCTIHCANISLNLTVLRYTTPLLFVPSISESKAPLIQSLQRLNFQFSAGFEKSLRIEESLYNKQTRKEKKISTSPHLPSLIPHLSLLR